LEYRSPRGRKWCGKIGPAPIEIIAAAMASDTFRRDAELATRRAQSYSDHEYFMIATPTAEAEVVLAAGMPDSIRALVDQVGRATERAIGRAPKWP
jgi:hypothetical protein